MRSDPGEQGRGDRGDQGAPSRIGRPARIGRDDIARAVLEIGFDDATIKRVAAHLGVSVPGLYYYVRGRDDLLRVAAEYALARTQVPEYTGQHWARWLREWGRHTRTAMAANPALIQQYLAGGLSDERVVASIGRVLEVLVDAGFTPDEAAHAWGTVAAVALGSAVQDVRLATEEASTWRARTRAVLERHDTGSLTAMRALAGDGADGDAVFEDRLTTVLAGIALRAGLDLDEPVTDHPDNEGGASEPSAGAGLGSVSPRSTRRR
jgi:AcrR family transcriptional regulator